MRPGCPAVLTVDIWFPGRLKDEVSLIIFALYFSDGAVTTETVRHQPQNENRSR